MASYTQHLMSLTQEIVASICFSCLSKIPAAIFIGGFAWFFGVENTQVIWALISIMVIDFLTGVSAARKCGEAIESRKAIKTVLKFVFYGLFISAAYLTEQTIPGETFLDNATISFLAITELISIMENIGKMGYQMPLKMLNKLRELRKEL